MGFQILEVWCFRFGSCFFGGLGFGEQRFEGSWGVGGRLYGCGGCVDRGCVDLCGFWVLVSEGVQLNFLVQLGLNYLFLVLREVFLVGLNQRCVGVGVSLDLLFLMVGRFVCRVFFCLLINQRKVWCFWIICLFLVQCSWGNQCWVVLCLVCGFQFQDYVDFFGFWDVYDSVESWILF